eukprot:gene15518-biopygen3690
MGIGDETGEEVGVEIGMGIRMWMRRQGDTKSRCASEDGGVDGDEEGNGHRNGNGNGHRDDLDTVNIYVLVGPTELFAGKKISQNPFLGPPLPVSTPPTTFDNVGAAGGDPANLD